MRHSFAPVARPLIAFHLQINGEGYPISGVHKRGLWETNRQKLGESDGLQVDIPCIHNKVQ